MSDFEPRPDLKEQLSTTRWVVGTMLALAGLLAWGLLVKAYAAPEAAGGFALGVLATFCYIRLRYGRWP